MVWLKISEYEAVGRWVGFNVFVYSALHLMSEELVSVCLSGSSFVWIIFHLKSSAKSEGKMCSTAI